MKLSRTQGLRRKLKGISLEHSGYRRWTFFRGTKRKPNSKDIRNWFIQVSKDIQQKLKKEKNPLFAQIFILKLRQELKRRQEKEMLKQKYNWLYMN